MLVLTRRESDRIDFPGLGISIEVLRLTRARAALGIVAPRNIRVVRHELLAESGTDSTYDDELTPIDQELAAKIEGDLDAASAKLKDAQKDLLAGKSKAAFSALSEALSELDALRSMTHSAAEGQMPEAAQKRQSNHWDVAGGVAESKAGYARSGHSQSLADQSTRQNANGSHGLSSQTLAAAFRKHGLEANRDGDALRLLCEVVQRQNDDTVLLVSNQSDPESIVTLALIPDSRRHPEVPVLFADDFIGDSAVDSGIQVTPSRDVSPHPVG